jgi:chemotaxis protein CheD
MNPALVTADAPVERERMYLHPGHSFIATAPTLVTTILGSCVSVCFWDETGALGAITHYLLPKPISAAGDAARFGTTAIEQVVGELRRRGAGSLSAKVFGGSAMNSALAATGRDLGTQNVAVAMEALAAMGIPILAADTGGAIGRKLLFQTDDGTAWVKLIGKA